MLDEKQGMLVEYPNNTAVGRRVLITATETGNEGRRIIRSQSSQRERTIDTVEEHMDEYKGQTSCRLVYFGAVALDRVL